MRPTLHVPQDVYPPKCMKFNAPVCLNVQLYEQTKLQAVPVILQDTIRPNRLTQESCSQSIWKYDCPSMTNQGLSKANSWTIAQALDGKKKASQQLCAHMKERKCLKQKSLISKMR